jgi:hypothetical protein
MGRQRCIKDGQGKMGRAIGKMNRKTPGNIIE